MFYLFLAIVSSMLVSVVMRLSEKQGATGWWKLALNYLMCTGMAFAFSGSPQFFPQAEGLGITLLLGCATGVLYLLGFVLLQWNTRRNGVVLPATFMKMGVIVPTLISILFYGEAPRVLQVLGIALALAAIVLMQGRGRQEAGSLPGLIALLLSGGTADAMSKIFEEMHLDGLKDQFLLYTFGTALVLCVILCLVRGQRPAPRDILWGLALGIPNYFSARFLLLALGSVPAVVAYPSFSVGTIVLVTGIGLLCFGERLSRRKWGALGMIIVALILLNI